jgi:hypothetical protein
MFGLVEAGDGADTVGIGRKGDGQRRLTGVRIGNRTITLTATGVTPLQKVTGIDAMNY